MIKLLAMLVTVIIIVIDINRNVRWAATNEE